MEKVTTKKFNDFLDEAKKGSASAMYNLGLCYQYGLEGVDIDLDEMLRYYEKAAKKGHAMAQNNLGFCYENGVGVPTDIYEATSWYKKAASKGNNTALCNLLNLREEDANEALMLDEYKKLASKGNARAKYKVGKSLITLERVEGEKYLLESIKLGYMPAKVELYNEYVDYFLLEDKVRKHQLAKELANEGLSDAIYYMGYAYYHGEGEDKNLVNALEMFTKGVELDNGNCAYYLGRMYYNGEVVEKNYDKALEYYLLATRLGNANSANEVGYMYDLGIGVKVDKEIAVKYYTIASKQYNLHALANLAYMYEYGEGGLEIDYDKSYDLYHYSFVKGNVRGAYKMGKYHHYGYYHKKDYCKALEFYNKAIDGDYTSNEAITDYLRFIIDAYEEIELGDYVSKAFTVAKAHKYEEIDTFIALCYEKGIGREKDEEKAKQLLQECADKDYKEACYYMGDYLMKGRLFAQNYSKGTDYLLKAVARRHVISTYLIGKYVFAGKGFLIEDKLAFKYFSTSSVYMSYPPAFVELAKCYLEGKGVKQNIGEGLKWITSAVKVRDAEAMYILGTWLIEGTMLPKKQHEGAYFWIQAMERYHKEATKKLVEYCDKGVISIEKKLLNKARRRLERFNQE